MKNTAAIQRMFIAGFALVLFMTPAAQGQMASDEGLGITGLVLDETKTKGGHDFYEFFTVNWNAVKGLEYTLRIMEQPDRARGSFIKVLINDRQVYFQRLNPRTDAIEEAAKQAVQRTRYILVRRLLTKNELEGAP